VPIIDDRTGLVSREWYRYFYSLYAFTGGGTGILPVTSGGTGLDTIPTDGQLLIGDTASSGYKLHVIDTGAGIAITNGAGTILITNTGVLSNIAGSGIGVSSATGNVTVSNTGVLSAIAGSGISVSSATGNVTFANTGVLSFSGGSTGLLPSTATTGVVSLSGTLGVGYGGTGQTTYTNGQLLIGNTTGNTLTKATLTAGSGVSISNGSGSITISATGSGGTVTSVTGTAPVVSSGGTTPAISMAAATTSVNGYLTSTDWTTFNGKQAALVSGTNIKTVNGTTLLGSGDVGTITYAYGGTGQTTVTTGDLLYGSAANTWSKLAVGTTGQVLRVVSGAPAWGTDYTGTVTSVGGTGTVNGITLTGTVTSSGNLTLGGTLSGVSLTTQVSGVLPIANGGTNASTASITSFNNITGYSASGATGTTSTNLVFSTSPTLVTPTLGAALATSIKFGSGSVLSSYETGTWTPVCSRATGGAITAVYDTQLGKYIKVGNVVTVSAFINITTVVTQGSGENRVSGLPYAPADNTLGAGAVARNNAFTTSVIISCFGWGDSEMRFMDNTNSVTPVSVDWKSGVVNFTFSYFV
jgi:hypothetical protein